MQNFNRPYLATSIREFWQRWHISLSTWFRDYLYIPLGGSRVPILRGYFNTFVVFLVSGLWHGANWTFVIWGALHGFYMVFAKLSQPMRDRINKFTRLDRVPALLNIMQICITFALASFAWIFFRARSLNDAMYIVSHIFRIETFQNLNLFEFPIDMYISIFLILFLFIIEALEERSGFFEKVRVSPAFVRWTVYLASIISLLALGVWRSADFIYFQF
jgi:alginate O-acetyltransferase complex protein AlgI